jgi:ABC-type multidrug transport system fused ATPase/permease subunit
MVALTFVSFWQLAVMLLLPILLFQVSAAVGAMLWQIFSSRVSVHAADVRGSHRYVVIQRGSDFRMAINRDDLQEVIRREFGRLDAIAASIAVVAAFVLIFVLDMQWAIVILLALAIYVGVHLLRPQSDSPEPILERASPEQEAIAAARVASAKIAGSIPELQSVANREQVAMIVTEIDMMLDAIEEDATRNESKLAAAPLYYSRLVHPFDDYLSEAIRLWRRKVKLADVHLERLESDVLPRYTKAAQEFYQEYHSQDVLDLAALAEILMYNLDSLGEQWENGEPSHRESGSTSHDQFDTIQTSRKHTTRRSSINGDGT